MARVEGILEQMDRRLNHVEAEISNLRVEISNLRAEMSNLRAEVSSLFKWTVGLILGMWVTVMMTLVPILLKILGVI